jgi:5'-3' exonuclease
MNQISVASVMMHLHMSKRTTPDNNMVRHMILNSLRMYRTRFSSEFGELVLCYDSKHYWRRDYFPQYKANRKRDRKKSAQDWDAIFECLNTIKEEIETNMPYKFLEIYGAEADDIIATICTEYDEEIMILSGDKDFIQLQRFPNVKQYSPITQKMVNRLNPDGYLREHILKGDVSDGIPNVLSPDHTFTDGLRQHPLTKKKIASILETIPFDSLPEETKRNYQRNKKLIDLTSAPPELSDEILKTYRSSPYGDRSKLLNYFIQKRLRTLTESIGEF